MSRADELTREHCPEGVRFEPLAWVGTWYGGGTPSKGKAEYWEGGTIPWISPKDMGGRVVRSTIDAISEQALRESASKLVPANSVAMVVRSSILDHTFPTALVPVAAALNQDMKAVVPREGVMPSYLAHLLSASGQGILRSARKSGGSVASIDSARLMNFRIPVPPLEVQREIVRILDQFTQLEAELEAELEARRVQYDFYQSQLLGCAAARCAYISLGRLGRIVTGRTPRSLEASVWGDELDFVTPSDIKDGMRTVASPSRRLSSFGVVSTTSARVPAGSLLTTCIGADMGKTVINANDCVPNQQINAIILAPGVETAYLFHVLRSMRRELRAQGARGGGTMPLINKSDFSRIQVPVPSPADQMQIAATLDEFDALLNDLSVGLPAELAARRKQYEYYRDKLLTFKEAVA